MSRVFFFFFGGWVVGLGGTLEFWVIKEGRFRRGEAFHEGGEGWKAYWEFTGLLFFWSNGESGGELFCFTPWDIHLVHQCVYFHRRFGSFK